MFEVRLLGRFSISRQGEEIPAAAYEGRLVRTLLCVLAARRGTFVPRDTLVEALWPNRLPADPERNLNVIVARARRALGDPALIHTEPGGYCFDSNGRCWIDAEEFARLVEEGRRLAAAGLPGDALKRYSAALQLWKGDPLPAEAYQDWAGELRATLLRLHQEALEGGAQAALREGKASQAVLFAEQAVAEQPLRESANLILAVALHASSDNAGALAVIAEFKSRLADELGLDPTNATGELEFSILNGGPSALGRSLTGPHNGSSFDSLDFVGRQDELGSIITVLAGGGAGIVLVEGSSGTGKTRLLSEVRAVGNVPLIEASAFLAERDEPWSLARALIREVLSQNPDAPCLLPERTAAALIAVVPELADLARPEDVSTDPESRRALALEGALTLVRNAAGKGAAVVIDDLQWADPTSLSLLGQLSRRMPAPKMILSYRPEEIVPDSPPARLLDSLKPSAHRVELGPLCFEAIVQLVGDPDLRRVILDQSDATPLAINELLRELASEGSIQLDETRRWVARSADAAERAGRQARVGKAKAFLSRIDGLAPAPRRLIHLVALLGRPSSAGLLALASSTSEIEILKDLEGLARSGLVSVGELGWDTAHDLIADSIAAGLESGEKARLHSLLARALQSDGADPWERARHLAQAGDNRSAAQAFVEAGRHSLDSFATEEAERSANAGLDLRPAPAIRSELLEIRAEALVRRGMLKEGRRDLRAALPAKRSGPERSRIISKLAVLISGSEDYLQAGELAALAVTEAGTDPATRASALAVASMVHGNLNHPEEAERMGAEALALYESIHDAHGVADILELKALHTLNCGNLREGVRQLAKVVALFQDSGKLMRVGQPRTLRSFALVMEGRSKEALREMDEVFELEQSLGHAEGIVLAHAGRSIALTYLQRVAEALQASEISVAVARNLGHKELMAIAFFVHGLALAAASEPGPAEQAYLECIEEASNIPIFLSMAAARLSTLKILLGDLQGAERYLAKALQTAPPFSMFEGRLAEAELAAATRCPDAHKTAARALEIARAEGYQLSIPRLSELARMPVA